MDNLLKWFIANHNIITLVLFLASFLVWLVPGITNIQWWRAAISLLKLRWKVWHNPNDANAHFLLGTRFDVFKRYAEAEAEMRTAIRLDPHHTDALTYLTKFFFTDQSRNDEIEALLRQVIEIDPKHKYALYNLARILLRTNRFEEGELIAKQAIEADPKYAHAYFVLGCVFALTNRYAEAEQALKNALELDKTIFGAHELIGDLASRRKDYAEAEHYYRNALQVDPTCKSCLSSLIQVLRYQQKDRDALLFLKRLIALAPKDLGAILGLATVHKKLGHKSEFAEWAIKAESMIQPDEWDNLACFEAICDRPELAFEHLTRAAKQADFDCAWTWLDPDLEDIRNDPRFEQIVGARPG
jgi:tetratricopeptide (TPR) repeat protein